MPPPYCYDYPRPAVTVDLVVFTLASDGLLVLLIRRKHDPFAGRWALPGGFLEIDEPIEDGARRELLEETGVSAAGQVAFVGVFGEPDRDPRGRTISLAHATILRAPSPHARGSDDAEDAAWRLAGASEPLAFDHDAILAKALAWLADGVEGGRLGLDLLPEEFETSEIRAMHRVVLGSTRGAGRWLRRMEEEGRVAPREGSPHRYRALEPA